MLLEDPTNPAEDAFRLYVPAANVPLIWQPAKVAATPFTAFTVRVLVQVRVPWVVPPFADE
jgi:hypothetical protein